MSKAILVIDMPHSCESCMFHPSIGDCKFVGDVDRAIIAGVRDSRCPLKSLPAFYEFSDYPFSKYIYEGHEALSEQDIYEMGYKHGWNKCRRKIVGDIDEKEKED